MCFMKMATKCLSTAPMAAAEPAVRDAWRAEGQDIRIEQIAELRQMEGVSGVHIMAIEWEAAIRPIVERAGLLPRPIV